MQPAGSDPPFPPASLASAPQLKLFPTQPSMAASVLPQPFASQLSAEENKALMSRLLKSISNPPAPVYTDFLRFPLAMNGSSASAASAAGAFTFHPSIYLHNSSNAIEAASSSGIGSGFAPQFSNWKPRFDSANTTGLSMMDLSLPPIATLPQIATLNQMNQVPAVPSSVMFPSADSRRFGPSPGMLSAPAGPMFPLAPNNNLNSEFLFRMLFPPEMALYRAMANSAPASSNVAVPTPIPASFPLSLKPSVTSGSRLTTFSSTASQQPQQPPSQPQPQHQPSIATKPENVSTNGQKRFALADGSVDSNRTPKSSSSDDNTQSGSYAPTQRVFRCSYSGCTQSRRSLTSLQRHEKKHLEEAKSSTCAQCSRRFACAAAMERHARSHTGDKPYVCRWKTCARKFADVSNVKRHELSHLGCKPYSCPQTDCGRAFTRRSTLKTHMISVHGFKTDDPTLVSALARKPRTTRDAIRFDDDGSGNDAASVSPAPLNGGSSSRDA